MNPEDEDFSKMRRRNENFTSEHILFNNYPLKDFLGLTPFEMHSIIYDPFGDDSEFQVKIVEDDIQDKIPFFMLAEELLLIIYRARKVKLTSKGFLPLKYCDELGRKEIIKESIYELPERKRIGEDYLPSFKAARIALMLGELITCKNNKIIVSDYGFQLLEDGDRHELFKIIFYAFTEKFLWAHLDGHGSALIGQLGFVFSLSMLKHYVETSRDLIFYANKYRDAFPLLMNYLKDYSYYSKEKQFLSCYRLRVFERFFQWFGFINVDEFDLLNTEKCRYCKTNIVDKLLITPELFKQFL